MAFAASFTNELQETDGNIVILTMTPRKSTRDTLKQ